MKDEEDMIQRNLYLLSPPSPPLTPPPPTAISLSFHTYKPIATTWWFSENVQPNKGEHEEKNLKIKTKKILWEQGIS